MNPALPALRWLLLAALTLAGFWLLDQTTVATWLALDAERREAGWRQGQSPWQWDFSERHAIVPAGSHGLKSWRATATGLGLELPADGVTSLSLALHGSRIDPHAVEQARMHLQSDHPLRVVLLAQPASGAEFQPWTRLTIAAGAHQPELQLGRLRAPITALQLRLEAEPGARVELHSLALLARPCLNERQCASYRTQLPPGWIPEDLLARRDRLQVERPAIAVEAGGWAGQIGRTLAPVWPLHSVLLAQGVGVTLLLLLACRLPGLPNAPGSPLRRRLQGRTGLLVVLGCGVLLLLAGWPALHTPHLVSLVLWLALVSWVLLPLPPRRWTWLGDRAAWRAAGLFTLLAMVLTGALYLYEPGVRQAAKTGIFLRYPVWALVQQWLLLVVVAPRFFGPGRAPANAALACAVVFALMHTPNFGLMTLTLLGGSAWAWLGERHRALLPLVASHAILGLWLLHMATPWLLRSGEIGSRYLLVP